MIVIRWTIKLKSKFTLKLFIYINICYLVDGTQRLKRNWPKWLLPKIPESKIQLQNITLTKKNKDSVIGEKQNKINIIDADNDVVVVERGSVSQEEKAKEVLKALEIAKQESSESLQPWFNSDLTEEQKKQVEACFSKILLKAIIVEI